MKTETEIDRQAALVRDEIVQAAAVARSELVQDKARASELEKELERLRGIAAKEAESAGNALFRANKAIAETQAELERERRDAMHTQERLASLERSLESESAARRADQARLLAERTSFRRQAFSTIAIAFALLVLFGVWYLDRRFGSQFGLVKVRFAAVVVGIAVWLTGVVGGGDRVSEIQSWDAFQRFRTTAVRLRGIAWLFASGVAVNAMWDWLKS